MDGSMYVVPLVYIGTISPSEIKIYLQELKYSNNLPRERETNLSETYNSKTKLIYIII